MKTHTMLRSKILGSKFGFSLVETVVACFILSIVLLSAVTLIYNANMNYFQSVVTIDAENQLNSVAFELSKVLSYVDNVQSTNGPVNTNINIAAGSNGEILNQALTTIAGGQAGTTVAVANFIRPTIIGTSIANAGNYKTVFTHMGIFYKYPDPTKQTSGVLFIDSPQAPLPPGGPVTPSYSDLYFPRLTSLEAQTILSPTSQLTAVRFIITARLFIGGTLKTWYWCPPGDVGLAICSPPGASPSKDIVRDFVITFNNQIVANPSPFNSLRPERVMGGLYLFPIQDLEVRK